MEKLFSALAHPDRLWIVGYLVAEGPTLQKDVQRALQEANPEQSEINSGAMSILVTKLVDAGLVRRTGRRTPILVPNPGRVSHLLALASAIASEATADLSQKAQIQHAELMRRILSASGDLRAAGS